MSLSNNSKLILEDLERDNNGMSQTNVILPDRANDTIIYIDRYENPAKKLDERQEVYTKVNEINTKKSQIVTLCNQAFVSAGSTQNPCLLESNESLLYGDGKILKIEIISSPGGGNNGTYSNISPVEQQSNPSFNAAFTIVRQNEVITSVTISNSGEGYSAGNILTIKGSDIGMPQDGAGFDLILEVSQTDEDNIVFSETGITLLTIGSPASGPGFPSFIPIAFGTIRRDRIRVIYYPLLEDQSSLPQTDNTLEGLIFPRITSSSSLCGKGRNTILSANSSYNDGSINYRINDDAGTWGVDGLKRGSGWSGGDTIMGNFYKIKNDCGGRRTQINSLINQISTLRSEINSILQPISPLKDKKHGFQLQSWSYRRSQQVNINTINTNNSLKDFINDPNNNDIFK